MANMQYRTRFIELPNQNFLVLGPRGTGKSTWLLHTFPEALRLDLLDRETERQLLAKPERLVDYIKPLKTGDVCIIDEIQRVPDLLPVIHSLIEQKLGIQFILTGNSVRKIRRETGNLLGGRLYLLHMSPYLAAELGDDFELAKALQTGLVPMVWESEDPERKAKAYAGVYLKEEIQAEGYVRRIGDFARFMEIASFAHGNIWSSTEISRESQVKRQTVDNYLQILEDLLIAFTVPVFTRRAKRKLVSQTKFYYFDTGIFRSLRPTGPLDKEADLEGPALEGLIAQHLRAWVFSQDKNHGLYFWRTSTKIEVDFVIYGPRGFWAIDVKRSCNITQKDVKPLKIFKQEYPEATCILLYGGNHKQEINGITCLPITEFLKNLIPENTPYN